MTGKIIDVIHKGFASPGFMQILGFPLSLALWWEVKEQDVRYYYYEDEIRFKLGDYFHVKKGNIKRDLMRTILADGALGSEQPLRRIDRFIEAIERTEEIRQLREQRVGLSAEQKQIVADYEQMENLALVAEKKDIFFTKGFQFGLVSCVAEIGDQIAILHGSKAPVVLRKVVGDKENEYKVICQCYLNGWMYGQSPREMYGKDASTHPHPHGKWWDEEPDEFLLV